VLFFRIGVFKCPVICLEIHLLSIPAVLFLDSVNFMHFGAGVSTVNILYLQVVS
jgi:hypothetical protein